jgi:hypothetical protein
LDRDTKYDDEARTQGTWPNYEAAEHAESRVGVEGGKWGVGVLFSGLEDVEIEEGGLA